MIPLLSSAEVSLLEQSALLVSKTISYLASEIKIGVSTFYLDNVAEDFICSHSGATPSFKNYKGFPFSICTSVNHAVVHGFPSKKCLLQEGDVVSLDVGVYWNGFHGDSAFTFYIKESHLNKSIMALLSTTRESLDKAIAVAVQGNRVGDIGYAVQTHCESRGFGVVRELTGHGVGRQLHEKPNIPNFGKAGSGVLLQQGMAIAIEPMITLGTHKVQVEKDGWTVTTKDKKTAAHFEHTIVVGLEKADVLSDFHCIDEAVSKNPYLYPIQ